MHLYLALCSHIYPYMQHICAQEVCKIPSQCIHTQEAGARYTKLDTAMVQRYPTSMERPVALAQIPYYMVVQLNKHHIQVTKQA